MGELPLLKLVEVLGVVAAGGVFVWWQLRDVKRAQQAARREREARQAREGHPAREAGTPHRAEAAESSRPGER